MTLYLRQFVGRSLSCLLLAAVLAGCDSSGTTSTTGAGMPAAGQSGAAPAAGEGLPPDLVTDVEAVIRLAGEYNALAAQVTTTEAFIQHRDELSRIDNEMQPHVDNIYIGESKLSDTLKKQFHSTYYDTKVFPLMQEKSAHRQRIQGLVK